MDMRVSSIAILSLLLTGNALANPIVPPGADPGAILQYNTKPWATPQELNPDSSEPSNEIPTPVAPEAPNPLEEATPPFSETNGSPLKVELQAIHLEGATLLPPAKVEKLIAPYRGKAWTFDELQALADELTLLYIQAGYVNSQVYIPPQEFTDKTLVLKALETTLAEVIFEKDRWFSRRAVLPRLGSQPGEVFNVKPLVASLRLINENPDLKVRATLRPGEESGTTNVILKAEDQFPVHLTPFWDNLGRDLIGEQRFGLSLAHNNVTGFGDRTVSSINFSKRSLGLANQYAFPIGSKGTQLEFDYAYSHIRPGNELQALKIRSNAHIFSPSIRQPLWRSDRTALNFQLAFDFKNLETEVLDTLFSRDRIRLLRPGFDGYVNDAYGRTLFHQEFGIGLDAFGGSVGNTALSSKAGSGTKFFRMNGGVTRIQRMPFNTVGVLRSRYQYSPDRLLVAEQFQVGGAYTVRGYSEGRQLADKGYLLNAEWYIPAFIFPEKLQVPYSKIPLRQAIQMVGFVDYAQVFTSAPLPGELRRASLLGAGVGLRLQITRMLVGRVDLGFPLLHQRSGKDHGRLHFGLQSTVF